MSARNTNKPPLKFAYDIKCNSQCKTRSFSDLQNSFGTLNHTSLSKFGYEYDKPCKFPFRVAGKFFHGCVYSDQYDTIGPWCFTDTTETEVRYPVFKYQNGSTIYRKVKVQVGKPKKWGICSDGCPIEDCPSCKFPFTYEDQKYDQCTNKEWPKKYSAFHYKGLSWCKYGNASSHWKFCSKACENSPDTINSQCEKNFIHDGKLTSHCVKKDAIDDFKSCPIITDEDKMPLTWATCVDTCPNSTLSDSKDIRFFSISIPVISLLIFLIGLIVCWKKCKAKHAGSFIPKADFSMTDLAKSKCHQGTQQTRKAKYELSTATEKNDHLVEFNPLVCQNFTNSSKGDLTKINPNLSLNEQINVIPYNSKYEIPFSSFQTIRVVGSGNFGTVYEGKADIPALSSEPTKVAVKTVTQQSNPDQFSALISEIKILSNLSNPHINLVNMLGCCTSRLTLDGNLWLFLEYCDESDIKTYLIEHTKVFMTGMAFCINKYEIFL